MGNPQQPTSQDNQQPRRDFGEMPDLDDLLLMADIDESDVVEALVWLEDIAPDAARRMEE